jgi:hypothetical protein
MSELADLRTAFGVVDEAVMDNRILISIAAVAVPGNGAPGWFDGLRAPQPQKVEARRLHWKGPGGTSAGRATAHVEPNQPAITGPVWLVLP